MKNKYYRVVLNHFESGDIPDFPMFAEEINNKLIDIISNEEITYASPNNFLNINGLSYNEKYLVNPAEVIHSLKTMSQDDILNYRKNLYYLKKKICSCENISFGNNNNNIDLDFNDKNSINMYKERTRIRKQVFKVIKID